ncbi:MAG: hypothetical protein M1826_006184 [Phylliscum demangeonii]|nr:MAG: hypothetical protein M1826_006184 [Phylliscum demangeonii]
MFVVPPPPQGPGVSIYGNSGLPTSVPAPVMETHNLLSTPTGAEYQLVVGEGTYILRDDLLLSTPQPHPSEASSANPNPLATTVLPPTAGTKLSLVRILPRPTGPPPAGLHHPPAPRVAQSREELRSRPVSGDSERHAASSENSSTVVSVDGGVTGHVPGEHGTARAFGEGNASLMPSPSKDPAKRRKPKNNILKSNSSFVSRVIPQDGLAKRLQERNPEGWLVFANVQRACQWLDLASANKADQLTKILFTKAHALCHDINPVTKAAQYLDIIIGFSSGDILWYEPFSQKYARLNKNGVVNASAVSDIRWIPGSENLFLAAHMDGSLLVYDKEKEDAPLVDESVPIPANEADGEKSTASLLVSKSVNSPNQKCNPVACWKLSHQQLNGFAFAPDHQHLAVVSEDGNLRVINYLTEKLLDVYSSYYGGLLCVCWSPDGKYLLTGGQDDLVSIWSMAESRIVARCEGHTSWVRRVAFDAWRCDAGNYRFGSVGEDCKLLLWDFSVGMLHRPKASSIRPRGSISQTSSRLRSGSNTTSAPTVEVDHPVEARSQTARLPPVLAKIVDPHPLTWLDFQEDCIITACQDGHIRTWDRPQEVVKEG